MGNLLDKSVAKDLRKGFGVQPQSNIALTEAEKNEYFKQLCQSWLMCASVRKMTGATCFGSVEENWTPECTDQMKEFVQKKNPAIGYIRVEAEETLGHYSDWLQIKTQKIRNWNNLSFSTAIHTNQKIKLIFDKITADDFNRMRLEYHSGLEEDFFIHYEITGTLEHRIKAGDNIWYLCNYEYNMPYWLIVDYNKDVNFDNLKVGDKLIIPTIKAKG